MADFDEYWEDFKATVGPILVDAMAAETPVSDSPNDPMPGTLAESHSYQDGDEGRLEIISEDPRGIPLARFIIRGTQPHPIDPLGPYPLHWIGGGGEDVFAMHVDHPGTAPDPFNQRAWEDVRDEVVAEFKQTVGKGYALALLNPWRNKKI